MEMGSIVRSPTAPTLPTEPLRVYHSNARSASLPNPMTLGARYQRIQDGEGAFPDRQNSTTEPNATPGSSSSDTSDVDAESHKSWWNYLSSTFLSRIFSKSKPRKLHEAYVREYEKVVHDKVEDFEEGIPRLAALLSSHEDFGTFRGFFPYATRVLLQRILELELLAGELNELDAIDAAQPDLHKLKSVKLNAETDAARIELFGKLELKLGEYYDFLLKYTNVRALAPSPTHAQRSVHNWILKYRPLVTGQEKFIHHLGDFVSPTKKYEQSGLRGSPIESFIQGQVVKDDKSWFTRWLISKDDRNRSTDPRVHMYSDNGLENMTRVVTVALAVGFLLTPVFLLFLVSMTRAGMVLVVFGFVLAFSITMSVVSGARTQDLLIGTAAYGAFIVTFLGNMNQGQAPGAEG